MTLIIHAVGDGDLGSDILGLKKEQKDDKRKKHQEELESLIEEELESLIEKANSGGVDKLIGALIGALFENEYPDSSPEGSRRFMHSPIALELKALREKGKAKRVKFILVGTETGDENTDTAKTAKLVKEALENKKVKDYIERKYEIIVDDVIVEIGDLRERESLNILRGRLECEFKAGNSSGRALVNAFSGSTMVVCALMGLVDQIGFDWEIATPSLSESGDFSACRRKLQLDESGVFYWLRSLGYLEQAKRWAETEGPEELIDVECGEGSEHNKFLTSLEVLKSKQNEGTSQELAVGAAISMLRGDNGAGLLLRAWLEKAYEEKLEEENSKLPEGCKYVSVFREGRELGPILDKVGKRLTEGKSSRSDKWLLEHEWMNDAGKAAVHDAAAPTISQITSMRKEPELSAAVPEWMPWPFQRPILYIFAMGTACQPPTVPERILREPLKNRSAEEGQSPGERILMRLRRAYPGALLSDSPGLPLEFLILHSSDPGSKKAAVKAARSVSTAAVTNAWEDGQRPPIDIEYGPGDANDLIATSLVSEAVAAQVKMTLENKRPAAVVVVGTGQKGAVIGALEAAQKWCGKNAVPLFLQTFVDKSRGIEEPESQFHRVALHRSAKKALLKAALTSLRNMNLLSAVRVLGAGDGEMNELADRCDDLRREYVEAVNSKDPDADAATILDVLKVVRWLWEDPLESDCNGAAAQKMSADWETRSKLAVIAAEITSFKYGKRKLMVRNTSLSAGDLLSIVDLSAIGDVRQSGNGKANKKPRKANHKDLLELLYRVRSSLVVLHGQTAPDEALDEVLKKLAYAPNDGSGGTLNIVVPDGFSYPCLIDEVCRSVTEVAEKEGIQLRKSRIARSGTRTSEEPSENWEERYRELFRNICEELRRMESE